MEKICNGVFMGGGVRGIAPQPNETRLRLWDYIKTVISSVFDAQYEQYSYTVRGDSERTVNIPVGVNGKNISSTDFDLSKETADTLFNNGFAAAEKFLSIWNFEKWLAAYRK